MDKNRVAPDRLLTQETEFLLRLGGKEGKELEVFSSAGKCDLPDGYPAALPADRVGHAVASSQKKPRVFMCGGYSPKTTSVDRVNSVR